MYTANLKFYILDNTDLTEMILEKIKPFEDCVYSFTTIKNSEEIESIDFNRKLDCGIINFTNKIIPKQKNLRRISVVKSSEISAETLENCEDLWAMPQDLHEENLLCEYFCKTAKIMKDAFDYRRLNICFRTSFDSIPDLVWFKDTVGSHLFVNNEFCETVQKTREQIYKRGHYYIWDIPKEEYEQGEYVCLESEDDVVKARKTILFDENVKTKKGMSQFKTYKSPLIDENDEIFGTCGIAHDVSDLQNIHRELNVIIESMPFGVIMEDRNQQIISFNKKLGDYFPIEKTIIGTNYNEWKEKHFGGSKPSISGGEKKNITLGGRTRTICLNETPLHDKFGVVIGKIAMFSDITAEQEYAEDVKKKADTDFLTKLNNRTSLFEHLNTLDETPVLSLITIDLDNFKGVNDTYGHYKGDEALVVTSRVLLQSFPDDFVARLGGDEFLVVISRDIDKEKLMEESEECFCLLRTAFYDVKEFVRMSASFGLATSRIEKGQTQDIEKLLKQSDSALYNAKRHGKGIISF